MQTLEALNKKIKTAQDLLGVVKTMKSLAAVNIRQYEKAVESLEEYRGIVDKGWQVLLRFGGPVPRKRLGAGAVCMVIGSDQGMCGQFNEIIIAHAVHEVREQKEHGAEMIFWSAGEKATGSLVDMGHEEGERFASPGSLTDINTKVQRVVQRIESWQSARNIERFYLCHNMVSKEGGYTQIFYRLLPLDEEWAERISEEEWPGRCLPMMGLDQSELFQHLFHQYLFVSFYRAFAQSLASENAARLMAMQAAEKNVLERGEDLQALFREQRQANITNELLDIISGFEALSDDGY